MVVPTSTFSPPWVKFFTTQTSSISTTPTLVAGSNYVSVIDSIWICNTSTQDITITAYTLVIDNPPPIYFRNNHLISNKSSQDILNTSLYNGIPLYAPSTYMLNPTDLFHIYSNEHGTTFDCSISGRQLLELNIETIGLDDETKKMKLELYHKYLDDNPSFRKNIAQQLI